MDFNSLTRCTEILDHFRINNYTYRQVLDYLPPSWQLEAEQTDHRFLVFRAGDNCTDTALSATCNQIISNGVRFAALNTRQAFGWYSMIYSKCRDAKGIITRMLAKEDCKLEFLDVSFSHIHIASATDIIDSLPAHSKLKCIRAFDKNISTKHNELIKFSRWLTETKTKVALIGYPNSNFEEFIKAHAPEARIIEQYYETNFPGLHFTDEPRDSLYPEYSRALSLHWNTSYH